MHSLILIKKLILKNKRNRMKVWTENDRLLIVIRVQLLEDSLSKHNLHSKSHSHLTKT